MVQETLSSAGVSIVPGTSDGASARFPTDAVRVVICITEHERPPTW
ncbi:hypothetical protein [Streptomyces microflavus]